MTKLEELKALIKEDKSAILLCVKSSDEYSALAARDKASFNLLCIARELLPDLIAVAEAAENVHRHDFSVSDLDGDLMLDMRHLENALLPLTKDADK